ncbi:hypothetical protein Shyhy02_34780 [Streptomyces hygroscopicus subsp. hygroscopicus]|nr:hypothetical protein Shyhy02_34780 [Streptomyces hygroscopicus subsp. hygroscopicus]
MARPSADGPGRPPAGTVSSWCDGAFARAVSGASRAVRIAGPVAPGIHRSAPQDGGAGGSVGPPGP